MLCRLQISNWHVDQLKELQDSPTRRSNEFDDKNDWNITGTHVVEVCSDTLICPSKPSLACDRLCSVLAPDQLDGEASPQRIHQI